MAGIRAEPVARNYGNASEFFRELVRASMEREIEADLALLQATGKARNRADRGGDRGSARLTAAGSKGAACASS